MKTKTLLTLLAAMCACFAVAQAPPNYPPEEAAKHVGETATVTGRVDGFHQSGKGNIFLNMGGKYHIKRSQLLSLHRAPHSFLTRSNMRGERFPCLERLPYTKGNPRSLSHRQDRSVRSNERSNDLHCR
jgi:hypothetical protein